MLEQQTKQSKEPQKKEFVMGGEIDYKYRDNGERSFYMPKRDSYYLPPDSLELMLKMFSSSLGYTELSINQINESIWRSLYENKKEPKTHSFGIRLSWDGCHISLNCADILYDRSYLGRSALEISQLFGIELFQGGFYIPNLKIVRTGSGKENISASGESFKFELENILKDESRNSCIAGGSDRWEHYEGFWTEVHGKIEAETNGTLQILENIAKSCIVPSKFFCESYKDD